MSFGVLIIVYLNIFRFTNKVMSDSVPFQKSLVGKFEDIAHRSGSYLENNLPVVISKL